MKPTALVVCVWLGVLALALYCGVQFAHADTRLDRLEHRTLICHPIVGHLGDRVCVTP